MNSDDIIRVIFTVFKKLFQNHNLWMWMWDKHHIKTDSTIQMLQIECLYLIAYT